jgi:prevent-host-death family protein
LEQVRKTKKAICITRRGKPVAEVIPDRTLGWFHEKLNEDYRRYRFPGQR